MEKKTTVAHMVMDKLKEKGISLDIPDTSIGDLLSEHDAVIETIMREFNELFLDACTRVDNLLDEGMISFDDDGLIEFL